MANMWASIEKLLQDAGVAGRLRTAGHSNKYSLSRPTRTSQIYKYLDQMRDGEVTTRRDLGLKYGYQRPGSIDAAVEKKLLAKPGRGKYQITDLGKQYFDEAKRIAEMQPELVTTDATTVTRGIPQGLVGTSDDLNEALIERELYHAYDPDIARAYGPDVAYERAQAAVRDRVPNADIPRTSDEFFNRFGHDIED